MVTGIAEILGRVCRQRLELVAHENPFLSGYWSRRSHEDAPEGSVFDAYDSIQLLAFC